MATEAHQNPRIVLEEDHRHIATLLERLVVNVRADDRSAAREAWDRVERALLAHLDAEESWLFARLSEIAPSEAGLLSDEHAELRRMMGELDLAFDLHAVRSVDIAAFSARLADHAEREGALLYPVAERRLEVSRARALLAHLCGAAMVRAGDPAVHPSARPCTGAPS